MSALVATDLHARPARTFRGGVTAIAVGRFQNVKLASSIIPGTMSRA